MEKVAVEAIADNVKRWLQTGASANRDHLHDQLDVQTKSNRNDLVTNRDKATEKYLVSQIRATYPAAQIVGEEGFGDHVTSFDGLTFFVDPIDGTMNFVKQRDNFASMIGVYLDGQPLCGVIVDVMQNKCYWGGPQLGVFCNETPLSIVADEPLSDGLLGINGPMLAHNGFNAQTMTAESSGARILGSAGIEYTRLLTGKEVGYVSYLAPWDVAAGRVMAETLGLKVTQITGEPIDLLQSKMVVIATPKTHTRILEIASKK